MGWLHWKKLEMNPRIRFSTVCEYPVQVLLYLQTLQRGDVIVIHIHIWLNSTQALWKPKCKTPLLTPQHCPPRVSTPISSWVWLGTDTQHLCPCITQSLSPLPLPSRAIHDLYPCHSTQRTALCTEAHTGVCDPPPGGIFLQALHPRTFYCQCNRTHYRNLNYLNSDGLAVEKHHQQFSVVQPWGRLTGDLWHSSKFLSVPLASTFSGVCPSVQQDLFFQSLSAVSLAPNPNNTPGK